MFHAEHVLIDDGLQFAFHLRLHLHFPNQILFHRPVAEAVDGLGLFAVELQHVAVLHVLVGAVQVVDGKGLLGRSLHQVDAEREVGLVVADEAQQRGHDVNLLCHGGAHARLHLPAAGVVDDDGRAEASDVAFVFGMVALVGVVAGDDEQRVLEPRLSAGFAEEAAQRHVGVAYALVDGQLLLLVDVAILLGYLERVVRRRGEKCRHERLLHLRHLRAVVLQEGLVPDAPVAIEVGVAPETAVGGIVFATVVLLESRLVGESHEAHRPAVGIVEEGCLVAVLGQQSADAGVRVHRGRCEDEGFHKHRDAAQHRGHAVDALTAVAERMTEHQTFLDERVDAGRVALVAAALQVAVEGADVFASEALDDEDDDVLLRGQRVGWRRLVDGRKHLCSLVGTVVPIGHREHALADGADEGKRRVQHHGALCRTVHILVGIVDGDGSNAVAQSAATAADAQRHGHDECHQHHAGIDPLLAALAEVFLQDARGGIELPQSPHHHDEQHHQIPVAEQFGQEDAAQVALVAELAEDTRRGAPQRVGEVGRVAQVDEQCQRVDHHKHPLAQAVVGWCLLQVEGEEHQHDVERVGIDDGRRVEHQSSAQQLPQVGRREVVLEMAEVHQQIGHACYLIDGEGQ